MDNLCMLFEIIKASQTSDHPAEVAQPAEVCQSVPQLAPELDTCSICLEDFDDENEIKTLPCEHKLHLGCCKQLFEHSTTSQVKCPLCRANITN